MELEMGSEEEEITMRMVDLSRNFGMESLVLNYTHSCKPMILVNSSTTRSRGVCGSSLWLLWLIWSFLVLKSCRKPVEI